MSETTGYFKSSKRGSNMVAPSTTKRESVADISSYPILANPARNISKETCERFGIHCAVSQLDGVTPEAYYFPSINQKGVTVGYTKQDLTKQKEEDYHWTTVGSVSISNKLFGQDVAEEIPRKRVNLIISEGQWDCVSIYQSLVESVKGTKYAGIEPLVVSIPMGTGNAVEAILHNDSYVKSHQGLTIFFDDDKATPAEAKKGIVKGHEAREAVASALVGSGISLLTITPSHGFKDASDYMQAGKVAELAKLVQFGKKAYSAEKIVKAGDISLATLLEPRPEGIYVNCFPKLMQKIHGFRTRELVLLTAPSGTGKSSITSMFANAFADAGEKVGMIYLEETNKETLQRMVASKLKVNYLNFKDKPLECTTEAKIKEAYDDIVSNDKLVMLNHFGSLPITELLNKVKHMHLVEGCKYILLDHLSLIFSGSQVIDERKEVDEIMTQLASFCAANDVCVIAVSHINRSAAELFKPQKGKENEDFWVKITKEMMRSSSSLEQLSFIVLGVEPQIKADRSRGNVRITVLKNRPWAALGQCDEFTLDEDTWEVLLVQEADY